MLALTLPLGLLQPFHPYQELAQKLLPLTLDGDDGSHDVAHLHRVWKNARQIARDEGGELRILCAAVLLHDCVAVEKNSPQRHLASRMAAEKAATMLAVLGWSAADIEKTAHAIEAHSFSAAIPAQTLEAKILQDADRLDAIGVIGFISVAACAVRFTMPPIRWRSDARMTTSVLPWITSKPSCSNCKMGSRPRLARCWPSNGPSACVVSSANFKKKFDNCAAIFMS